MADLRMTSDRNGETTDGLMIKSGSVVEYLGHVIGGMIRVRLEDESEAIMHPHCFEQLR